MMRRVSSVMPNAVKPTGLVKRVSSVSQVARRVSVMVMGRRNSLDGIENVTHSGARLRARAVAFVDKSAFIAWARENGGRVQDEPSRPLDEKTEEMLCRIWDEAQATILPPILGEPLPTIVNDGVEPIWMTYPSMNALRMRMREAQVERPEFTGRCRTIFVYWTHFRVCAARYFLKLLRRRRRVYGQLVIVTILSIVCGILYGPEPDRNFLLIFYMVFNTLFASVSATAAVGTFSVGERAFLQHEAHSGVRSAAEGLARVILDIVPLSMIAPTFTMTFCVFASIRADLTGSWMMTTWAFSPFGYIFTLLAPNNAAVLTSSVVILICCLTNGLLGVTGTLLNDMGHFWILELSPGYNSFFLTALGGAIAEPYSVQRFQQMKFLVDSGLLPKCCSRDASDSARPLGVEDYESGSYPWYSIGMRNLFLFGLVMRVITIIIFVRSVSSRSRASRAPAARSRFACCRTAFMSCFKRLTGCLKMRRKEPKSVITDDVRDDEVCSADVQLQSNSKLPVERVFGDYGSPVAPPPAPPSLMASQSSRATSLSSQSLNSLRTSARLDTEPDDQLTEQAAPVEGASTDTDRRVSSTESSGSRSPRQFKRHSRSVMAMELAKDIVPADKTWSEAIETARQFMESDEASLAADAPAASESTPTDSPLLATTLSRGPTVESAMPDNRMASPSSFNDRARSIYGSQIARLVEASPEKIVERENAFTFFVLGAYRRVDAKPTQDKLTGLQKTAIAAAKAGDKATANAAIKEFVEVGQIQIGDSSVLNTVEGATSKQNNGSEDGVSPEAE